jgi:hypothetical protein
MSVSEYLVARQAQPMCPNQPLRPKRSPKAREAQLTGIKLERWMALGRRHTEPSGEIKELLVKVQIAPHPSVKRAAADSTRN